MARPKKLEADPGFIDRLEEIASHCGSRAALARAAGLTPGSVQNYFDGGEPTRRVLVALADAGKVSVEWLAAGRGPKDADSFLPAGYGRFPYFDLRVSGWRIHGLSGSPAEWVALKRSWFEQPTPTVRPREIQCINTPDDNFWPLLKFGDLIAIDRSVGGEHALLPLNFAKGALYAIAPEARILLRHLHREGDKGFIARAGIHGKLIKLEAFQIIGQVVWRSGPV